MFDGLRQALQRRLETLTGQQHLTSAEVADQAQADRLRTQGNGLIASGDLAGAEVLFREALACSTADTQTIVCLGYVLKEQGQLTHARVILKRAAQVTNHHARAF